MPGWEVGKIIIIKRLRCPLSPFYTRRHHRRLTPAPQRPATPALAPEHCEVITRDARKVSDGLLTAGAIFLGNWSPTVLGDYIAGPSHVLPTDGAGASFAGLTVDQFQRRTSVVEYNKASLKKALKGVKKFAELEGLDAHGKSAETRLK